MRTVVDYDQAADQYAAHRHLHPGVLCLLAREMRPGSHAIVLEVGCGTGNYLRALCALTGGPGWGLDPSAAMLSHARAGSGTAAWMQARAEQPGLRSAAFDLVFSVDVIHHVADKPASFVEAARLLRPGGRLCTVTDSEDIIRRREILSGYFPDTVDVELARYPRIDQLKAWMVAAGFGALDEVDVEQPYELTSAQPFRDRAFSSLHLISEAAWQAGLERLERDLARGPIPGVSRYACLWGTKLGVGGQT